MPPRLTRSAAVGLTALIAALTLASGASAATVNFKVPMDITTAVICEDFVDEVQVQGTIHLVQQGEFVEDAPRQHVVAHLNSQQLTGFGVPSGERYNVDLIINSISNSHVDGANVSTGEVMMNVVSLGSGHNFQIQTVLHTTINANGETTTDFQNFHVHCTG